ncbi:hypothetical protein ALC57_03045 [Trachymyrmex cornetzi]|uniref:Uncharacterized protein n=1 Tax=Trachymyrmex cornetzi TaxID=471704 RepID=A0A151JN27_9HYME|nr:hypothetical protein ALC57_03045 [Trachymyrmex cornetzi]
MTKSNLQDMLIVINDMLPQPNLMPKTLYSLFFYVKSITSPCIIIKHFYCKKCILYKGIIDTSEVCKLCLLNENLFFFEHKKKTVFADCLNTNISDSLLTEQDKNFLHQNLIGDYLIYGRAIIKDKTFTSEIYCRNNKTNSYTVQLISNSSDSVMYGTIRFFVRVANNIMYIVFRKFEIIHIKIFYHQALRKQVKHILPIEININQYILLNLMNIKSINKVIKVGDYVCNTPNLLNKVT